MTTKLNPYIHLNGNAGDAIALYETALGAKPERIMRWADGQCANIPPEHRDRIMHAALRVGDSLLMLSDNPPDMPAAAGSGSVHVLIDFTDPAEQARAFEKLSAGGTVHLPIQDMFWGAKFGVLTDAFGVQWEFHCETKNGN